jgi:hypothetical protein
MFFFAKRSTGQIPPVVEALVFMMMRVTTRRYDAFRWKCHTLQKIIFPEYYFLEGMTFPAESVSKIMFSLSTLLSFLMIFFNGVDSCFFLIFTTRVDLGQERCS